MIRPPLSSDEIKGLQEISDNLAGLQSLISEYKTKVDSIVNKYSNPKGALSKKSLLRKANDLEMKARIIGQAIRIRAKRYGGTTVMPGGSQTTEG